MDIKSILIRNFKGFGSDLVKIPFSEINLFFGKNSSGKTSVFHAISLLNEIMGYSNRADFMQMLPRNLLDDIPNMIHQGASEFEIGIILSGTDYDDEDLTSIMMEEDSYRAAFNILINNEVHAIFLSTHYYSEGMGLSFTFGKNGLIKSVNMYLLDEVFLTIDEAFNFNVEHPIYKIFNDNECVKNLYHIDKKRYEEAYNKYLVDFMKENGRKPSRVEIHKHMFSIDLTYNPEDVKFLFSDINHLLRNNNVFKTHYEYIDYLYDGLLFFITKENREIIKEDEYYRWYEEKQSTFNTLSHSFNDTITLIKKKYGSPFNTIDNNTFITNVKNIVDELNKASSKADGNVSKEKQKTLDNAKKILVQLKPNNFSFFRHTCNYLFFTTSLKVKETLNRTIYIGPLRNIPGYINTWTFESEDNKSWYDSSMAWFSLLNASDEAIETINDKLATDLNTPYQLIRTNYINNETNEKVSKVTLYDTFLKKELKFSNVGTGISQVLPIYIAAICNDGKIILSEQPELHLHPSAQLPIIDLAIDFKYNQGYGGNVFVFETHSEHMLLRIQKRIREYYATHKETDDSYEDFLNTFKVCYFEKSHNMSTNVTEIKLSKNGNLEQSSIPPGFFEESLDELF